MFNDSFLVLYLLSEISLMTLKQEKERFQLVAKRILKDKLTNDKGKLIEYKNDIITVYNENVTYVRTNYDRVNEQSKETYLAFIQYIRSRFLKCIEKLQFSFEFNDDNFQSINPEEVISIEDADESVYEISYDLEDDFRNLEETAKMTEEEKRAKFINTYNKTLPDYDGKFENLSKFIDACELMNDGVGTQMATAIKLIKTKLSTVPRKLITSEDTIDKVIDRLKNSVKPDSSRVINAKLMSLKQSSKTPHDYIKEVEDMAELLSVAFINEGMPPDLAESQFVDSAVRSLISNVHNSQVKTVLQSADLKSLNDVSTKFLSAATEQSTQKAQVFYNKRFNKRGRGSYRGRGGYNNFNSYNNNGYNNRGNGSYRGRRGSYRGRGNWRGNSHNSQSIRYTENCQNPQLTFSQYPQLTLGGESSTYSK